MASGIYVSFDPLIHKNCGFRVLRSDKKYQCIDCGWVSIRTVEIEKEE